MRKVISIATALGLGAAVTLLNVEPSLAAEVGRYGRYAVPGGRY